MAARTLNGALPPRVDRGMLEPFLHLPVLVESARGRVVGVLAAADVGERGAIDKLLVHTFLGHEWWLIKDWTVIKTSRSRV